MAARVIPFPLIPMTAGLTEALDAVDLLEEALRHAVGERLPSGMQASDLAVAAGPRQKHKRGPENLEMGGARDADS